MRGFVIKRSRWMHVQTGSFAAAEVTGFTNGWGCQAERVVVRPNSVFVYRLCTQSQHWQVGNPL